MHAWHARRSTCVSSVRLRPPQPASRSATTHPPATPPQPSWHPHPPVRRSPAQKPSQSAGWPLNRFDSTATTASSWGSDSAAGLKSKAQKAADMVLHGGGGGGAERDANEWSGEALARQTTVPAHRALHHRAVAHHPAHLSTMLLNISTALGCRPAEPVRRHIVPSASASCALMACASYSWPPGWCSGDRQGRQGRQA